MYRMYRKGVIFEDLLLERLEQLKGYEPSSREDDIYGGADFYYHRLPVDVTLNNNKKFTTYSSEAVDLPTCSIKVGARFGNGRVKFEEPVMVLLFLPKVWSYNLMASDVTEDVLQEASDIFWTLIDKLEEGGDEQ
jgi:hypothetical protein